LSLSTEADWRDQWRTYYVDHWYDRKTKAVDSYLNEAIVALTASAADIKIKRAAAAKSNRVSKEEDRRRQELLQREQAKRRHKYLLAKPKIIQNY
jgi:hypothetical protein